MRDLPIYNNTLNLSKTDPLYRYFKSLVRLTAKGAMDIYNIDKYENMPRKKFMKWCKVARDFVTDHKDFMMEASYGSAVEEYFNLHVKSIATPPGYRIRLQVDKKITIPDIVVYQDNKEIAWLDITSRGSQNHINKKGGAGWHTIPFVAEILYTPLDRSSISLSGDSIASRAKAHGTIRQDNLHEAQLNRYLTACVDNAMEDLLWRGYRCVIYSLRQTPNVFKEVKVKPNWRLHVGPWSWCMREISGAIYYEGFGYWTLCDYQINHQIIKSLLQRYLYKCGSGRHRQMVRTIFVRVYKNTKLNAGDANDFLESCFERYNKT